MALDPLNRGSARTVATAWELAGQADSARRWQAVADTGIRVEITVTSFVPSEQGATLTAIASNASPSPSAPLRLTVEFLEAGGEVHSSQAVELPSIPPQGSHQFELRVAGTSARGWRYRPS
jgi:hypothetical protein